MPSVLSPDVINLAPSQTQQFIVLGGDGNIVPSNFSLMPAVGTISSTGLYAAPTAAATAQIVTVIASQSGDLIHAVSSRVTLFPSTPQLKDFHCAPNKNTAQCTLTLSAAAPPAGIDVKLANSPEGAINAPRLWHIDGGALVSIFPVAMLLPGARLTATLGTSIEVTLYPTL
jgi:hypothetical protein